MARVIVLASAGCSFVVWIALVAACGSSSRQSVDAMVDGARTDAAIDAPVDATPHVDVGPDALCGAGVLYTGEYVDWDSSDSAFLGIFDAEWALEDGSGAHQSEHTPPNGRFILCLDAASDGTLVDVTPGSDSGSYLPGIAVAETAVIGAGVLTSTRSFTAARQVTMFQSIGDGTVPFDATKGQLFVHLTNTTATLSISATSLPAQSFGAAEVWSAGNTGTYVYFPNVTLAGPTVTLTASTAVSGAGSIPVTAGKFTYVEVTGP